ncbi:50S ribosomal protein L18 [Microgenomates group bacterium RBG_19FT_COMBO_39_10]|nr:ribosomal protein L18 [uncultured bacterium]OGV89199.1 MAG: 50S ribosomal protein L18 [Microgenomates group bacterium RBG_19FT_COMBO_39_10]
MTKKEQKLKRKNRVRQKIKGTNERPRLSVFRSNKKIYTQLINDEQGQTLVGASEKDLSKEVKSVTKTEKAKLIGEALAKKALKKKIKKVIFDRGPYRYHGRVKALAEGVREGGLKF